MPFGVDAPPDIELPMLLPEVERRRLWCERLLRVEFIEPVDEVDPIALPEPFWSPMDPWFVEPIDPWLDIEPEPMAPGWPMEPEPMEPDPMEPDPIAPAPAPAEPVPPAVCANAGAHINEVAAIAAIKTGVLIRLALSRF